jgi:hypothetical protein
MSNEGTNSKGQKITGEVMDVSQGCQNNGFCAASNSSFIAPSPEEGDCEEHKLMKFLQPGPPHFSNANAISQSFFTSEYMSKALGKALLVSQSQYQLTNIASQMQHNEVSLQLEISEMSYNLSTNQRKKLASILSACEELFMKQRNMSYNCLHHRPLQYTDLSKKYAAFTWRLDGQLFQTYSENCR